ncbi:ABC transporter substrate-binding protein [Thalassorhabdomicrobium marinisediminis]|uniref:ABC transporter substrate-binding protein n=1 Tax=Thalassorhabdomicrobium marinisediminis TaxID=2170577 RepID=UPI0024927306|nr:ABC transporter substrate-binding protein [Thalassorhabdomicrobium marinisediminis]
MKLLNAVLFALTLPSGLQADELRILTSFPSGMTAAFKELWDEHFPRTEIRFLNKNTISAVEEVQRGNLRGFDLFWASSPEAFVLLDRSDHFAPMGACGADGPASVEGFAISSVGWARRTESELFMPAEWNDLLLPIYRDQIAMARPARSGTTHLLVEQILQMRGWDAGWSYLLQLSSNLSTLTARSHGVPSGLLKDRFDIGLMIDFLALSQGEALQFRYGRPTMIFAAQIGILNGGGNGPAACDFVRLLLSRDGQMTLTDPRISRTPIDPDVRHEVAARIPQNITTGLQLAWLDYDAETSADRFWAVNTLFDLMITDVLNDRRSLWRRYSDLQGQTSDEAMSHVRRLLSTVPVSETQAIRISRGAEPGLRPEVQPLAGSFERDIVGLWRREVAVQLRDADAILTQLEQDAAR